MNHTLIRGVEVTKTADQLVIRNTWSLQTLGGLLILLIGGGFFGCCGFMGIVPVTEGPPDTRVQQTIGTVMAIVGIPLATLCLLALPLRTLRHRCPFVLDRRTDRFLDGGREVCALSDIRSIRVEECGSEFTEYAVRFIQTDGSKLFTLEGRIDEFQQIGDAERLAAEVAGFLSVEVAGGKP